MAVDDKGTDTLAMFGAPPLAHADDAARAAQAARDLLVMAEAQGLALAISVATGPVIAGPVGGAKSRVHRDEDAVDSAARLMSVAALAISAVTSPRPTMPAVCWPSTRCRPCA